MIDTNMLLNLYRYTESTRDELFNIFDALDERLWVPFHAALEFQRNRPTVIAEQRKRFEDVRGVVDGTIGKLEQEFLQLQLRDRHALIDPDPFINKLKPLVQEFREQLEVLKDAHPSVNDHDDLRDKIDGILGERVGPPLTDEDVREIFAKGVKRYEVKVPPGYMDAEKSSGHSPSFGYGGVLYQKKYGDLILWEQVIRFSKKNKPRFVVLLTDDGKEDWWWKVESEGEKTLGPRPELVEELKREAEVENFYIYNSGRFLEHAREFLQVAVSDASIEQANEIAKSSGRKAGRHRSNVDEDLVLHAVGNWVLSRYGDGSIRVTESGNWLDFVVVEPDGSKPVGVNIVRIKNPNAASSMVREHISSVKMLSEISGLRGLEIVYVFEASALEKLTAYELNMLNHEDFDLPIGVRLTLGEVVYERTGPSAAIFVPLVIKT